MKLFTLFGIVAITAMGLTACHKPKARKENPAQTEQKKRGTDPTNPIPGEPTIPPDENTDPRPPDNVKIPGNNVPPPPAPEKEVYAQKIPGRAGFVTDPGDKEHRPLDVRGMPPGTRIESPFTGAVLLVPPQ